MDRFSTIENINRRYRNSTTQPPTTLVGGYTSSYTPPAPSVVLGTNIGATVLRRSFVANSTIPSALSQGAQLIRVEEPAQVIYHDAVPSTTTRVNTTTVNVPTPIQARTVRTQNVVQTPVAPQIVDVPVVSRPVHETSAVVKTNIVGAKQSICPWWCWLIFGILGLLLLLGVIAGLWAHFSNHKVAVNKGIQSNNTRDQQLRNQNNSEENNQINNPTSVTDENNTQKQGEQSKQSEEQPKEGQQQPQEAEQPNSTAGEQQQPKQEQPKEEQQQPKEEQPKQEQPKQEQPKQQNENTNSVNSSKNATETQISETKRNKNIKCQDGSILFEGKCISCPKGAEWNGTNCVRKRAVTTLVSSETDRTEIGGSENSNQSGDNESNESENKSGVNSSNDSSSTGQSSSSQSSSNNNSGFDAVSDVKSGVQSVGQSAKRGISSLWDSARDVASNTWEGAKNFGTSAKQTASDATLGVVRGLKDFVSTGGKIVGVSNHHLRRLIH